jgi:O-antigen/teichoic acid export membrane protein
MFWRGVVGYLPVNVAQGIVGLLTIVVFTRVLSPAEYGAYALGFSAMTLVHTGLFTWAEAAMARFQARAAADGETASYLTTLYRAWAVLAAVFPILAGLLVWLAPLPAGSKQAVAAGMAAILFRSLARLAQERRRAAGEVTSAALLDVVQTVGGFAIGAGMAVLGAGGAAPLIGAGGIAALCLAAVLPRELKLAAGGHFERARAATYLAYGLPVAGSLILALVIAATDRFLLAAFLNEQAVGVYHAGYSLANRTLDVVFIWLGMAGGPAMVAALERGGESALRQTAREQASFMLLLTLPAAAGLALTAGPLAQVMIGPELAVGAARVTPWVAFAGLLSGLTTYYLHQAFTLGRRTSLLMAAMAVPAGANVALNLILIPRFGLDGAMWSTASSYLLGAITAWALGRIAQPLPIPWRTLATTGGATALMALAVIQVPAWGGALELFSKALVGMVVYGLAAWLLDAGGIRGQGLSLVRGLKGRLRGAAA